MEQLHEWHEFYVLLGTACAALLALLFVAVSIGVGFFRPGGEGATRTYLSPIIVHFTAVLFTSLVALAPTRHPFLVPTVLALTGLAGITVASVTTRHVFADRNAEQMTAFDHFA